MPSGLFLQVHMKMSSEDFVVMELDPSGCCVAEPNYTLPPTTVSANNGLPDSVGPLLPTAVNPEQHARTVLSHTNTHVDARTDGNMEEGDGDATTTLSFASPLSCWLATDVVERMKRLADGTSDTGAVAIGTFEDKRSRGALRCAVRWHFPALTTSFANSTAPASTTSSSGAAPGGRDVPSPEASSSCLVAQRDMEGYYVFQRCIGPDAAALLVRASIARDASTRIACPFLDGATKEDRARFHAAFRRGCSSLHCVVAQGLLEITTRRNNAMKRTREDADGAPGPAAATVYTHLVVQKINVETQRMKQVLADVCGVTDGHVGIAGTKDRRAVTWQRVSVRGDMLHGEVRPFQDSALPLRLAVDGSQSSVVVHSACIRDAPIALGDLCGNRFDVNVRCVAATAVHDGHDAMTVGALSERLREMEAHGFLNYFGQQRFGRGVADVAGAERNSPPALDVPRLPGIALLRGRPEDAVAYALDSTPPAFLDALHCTLNFGLCRKQLNPRTHRDALMMVECLAAAVSQLKGDDVVSPSDWRDATPAWRTVCQCAVARIPFYMRQLWLHAAQSWVFNVALGTLSSALPRSALPPTLPLVGAAYYEGIAGARCDDAVLSAVGGVLDKLGVETELLRKGQVAGVPLRGGSRGCVVKPTGCQLSQWTGNAARDGGDDTLWVRCQFALPSSSYATVMLQQLFGCGVTDAD